jgi:hypothetical protein
MSSLPARPGQDVLPLQDDRVGPYLRALQAGLHALAPNEDFVPLRESIAHLQALDPILSGDLLAPAELDTRSGLPCFPWMERAIAEQSLTTEGGYANISDAEIAQAARLDPALGRRMSHRRLLHRHLIAHNLLPLSRLNVALKRLGKSTDFAIAFDRMTPVGSWMRIRAELSGKAGWERVGPLSRTKEGRAVADPGLQHLLSRHLITPLLALRTQLSEATGGEVRRLSRSFVGPFWFPGLPLPERVPPAIQQGLLLHLSVESVAADIRRSVHRDPWRAVTPGESAPEGYGLYRERRFAASPNLIDAVKDWGAGQGMDVVVSPLLPGR